jgi:hypothetical protein
MPLQLSITPKEYNLTISIHTDIKLKTTNENNKCIRYFDSFIVRKLSRLEIDALRKPTSTDTTIRFF